MRYFLSCIILLILSICLIPAISFAKTGYVSDMLILTLREGPGNSFPVITSLRSDEKIEILEEQEKYSKIQTSSGEIGWVDKQYVVFDPPKTAIIEQLNQKIAGLESQLETLQQGQQPLKTQLEDQKSDFTNQINSLEKSLEVQIKENQLISEKLATITQKHTSFVQNSNNVQKIVSENKKLLKENQNLTERVDLLENQSRDILKRSMIQWFLAGVFVLLLGWFIGRSLVRKKKYSSGGLLD